jgi:integrase
MPRRTRVVTWNGKDIPPELLELPAGRYVVEPVEEEVPVLTAEEEAGIEAALESYRKGRVVDPKRAREIIDTAWRALRDAAGLQRLRFHDLRHTAITELAELGVADHVLESITGHLSRRMLEHYSHIRIDAKRQALDALDVQRGRVLPEAGTGGAPENRDAEIEAIIEVPESVTSITSQFDVERITADR